MYCYFWYLTLVGLECNQLFFTFWYCNFSINPLSSICPELGFSWSRLGKRPSHQQQFPIHPNLRRTWAVLKPDEMYTAEKDWNMTSQRCSTGFRSGYQFLHPPGTICIWRLMSPVIVVHQEEPRTRSSSVASDSGSKAESSHPTEETHVFAACICSPTLSVIYAVTIDEGRILDGLMIWKSLDFRFSSLFTTTVNVTLHVPLLMIKISRCLNSIAWSILFNILPIHEANRTTSSTWGRLQVPKVHALLSLATPWDPVHEYLKQD